MFINNTQFYYKTFPFMVNLTLEFAIIFFFFWFSFLQFHFKKKVNFVHILYTRFSAICSVVFYFFLTSEVENSRGKFSNHRHSENYSLHVNNVFFCLLYFSPFFFQRLRLVTKNVRNTKIQTISFFFSFAIPFWDYYFFFYGFNYFILKIFLLQRIVYDSSSTTGNEAFKNYKIKSIKLLLFFLCIWPHPELYLNHLNETCLEFIHFSLSLDVVDGIISVMWFVRSFLQTRFF